MIHFLMSNRRGHFMPFTSFVQYLLLQFPITMEPINMFLVLSDAAQLRVLRYKEFFCCEIMLRKRFCQLRDFYIPRLSWLR